MKQIVAATDFSSRSQRALRRAGLLARQFKGELTLVHVVDDDQPASLVEMGRREASKFLSEQIETLTELRDVHCGYVVATGEAFDGILRTAKSSSASLVVMGSHRKQLLRDIFVGTTIERVVRTGPYPVLMVNSEAEESYGQVLAAVDMSEPSAHAIEIAKASGLIDDVYVTIVHAFMAPAKGKLFIANATEEQIDEYVAAE